MRSITTYSIILEVKGIKIFFYETPEVVLEKTKEKIRPKMSLEKVNRFGLVEVSFNQTITVPKDWKTSINNTVLDIKIDPFNEENLPLKDLVWNIESFSSTRMTL